MSHSMRYLNISFSRNAFSNLRCLHFVPEHNTCCDSDVIQLQNFLKNHSRIFVMTGAGISTESGLPDYRSKDVGLYNRSSNRPVMYKQFIESDNVRKRYWARNFAAWSRFSSIQPNFTHFCLQNWEKQGFLHWLVTQNVDRLHYKAGSERFTELHGNSYTVQCLDCKNKFSRFVFQEQLIKLNSNFNVEALELRPDGDVDIDQSLIDNFCVPDCPKCEGLLKPTVFFFGETVPKERMLFVEDKLNSSDAVLILGSSLETYSSYRHVLSAHDQKKSIAIVNIGRTRADDLASLKLELRCGDILSKIKL